MSRSYLAGLALVAALTVSGLGTCLLALRWYFAVNEVQRLQLRAETMTRTSSLMQQLALDAVEHGRTHPPMQALLQQLNVRAAIAAASNSAPNSPYLTPGPAPAFPPGRDPALPR